MIDDMGEYVGPNGWFGISVPLGWTLRDDADLLQIESPTGLATVSVSVFVRRASTAEPDARVHLGRFLRSREVKGKPKSVLHTAERAAADFTESGGKKWRAMFLSSRRVLILATSTYAPGNRADSRIANDILDSIEVCDGRRDGARQAIR